MAETDPSLLMDVDPDPALPANSGELPLVIPANAGIQRAGTAQPHLDARFRGHDGLNLGQHPTLRNWRAKPRKCSRGRGKSKPLFLVPPLLPLPATGEVRRGPHVDRRDA